MYAKHCARNQMSEMNKIDIPNCCRSCRVFSAQLHDSLRFLTVTHKMLPWLGLILVHLVYKKATLESPDIATGLPNVFICSIF